MDPTKPQVPYPEIHLEHCKGCERCIAACPKQVLVLSREVNSRGYHYAEYKMEGCNGCGTCFYNCPEPDAICVIRVP